MKTINQAIQHLKFHLSGRNLQKVPALVGTTGIGKTAIINKVAKELGANVIYFNLAQMSEGDTAMPVPVQNSERALVDYALNHKIRHAVEHPEEKTIVFVDEFTRGTVPVISEWMTIINERQLQGTKFGPNIRFAVAMNPTSSMYEFGNTDYAATEMDDAHANRFTFIHVESTVSEWVEWGKASGIHPLVTGYLESDLHRRDFQGREENGIRVRTPRAWDFLSQSLWDMEEQDLLNDASFRFQVVADQMGHDIGVKFNNFAKELLETLRYEEVMVDKPLAESRIQLFSTYEENTKKSVLDGYIARLIEEKLRPTPQMAKNFIRLWETLESEDLKWAITNSIANDTFDIYREEGDTYDFVEAQYVAQLFYHGAGEESERYNKFVDDRITRVKGVQAILDVNGNPVHGTDKK